MCSQKNFLIGTDFDQKTVFTGFDIHKKVLPLAQHILCLTLQNTFFWSLPFPTWTIFGEQIAKTHLCVMCILYGARWKSLSFDSLLDIVYRSALLYVHMIQFIYFWRHIFSHINVNRCLVLYKQEKIGKSAYFLDNMLINRNFLKNNGISLAFLRKMQERKECLEFRNFKSIQSSAARQAVCVSAYIYLENLE